MNIVVAKSKGGKGHFLPNIALYFCLVSNIMIVDWNIHSDYQQ